MTVSTFKSSLPQRPGLDGGSTHCSGRPIGPTTYTPKNNLIQWENEPTRMTSSFASKTELAPIPRPITADIDFMHDPFGSMHAAYGSSPSSRGHAWPNATEPRKPARDAGLDEFSISEAGTLGFEVVRTSRNYASSFASGAKRMPSVKHATPDTLGPGSYNTAHASVTVRDPKRATHTFKSQTTTAMFDRPPANEPPDAIQSIRSAVLMKHWTSAGSAFSTRERFPRQRKRWKD